jgi:hypothetical protein
MVVETLLGKIWVLGIKKINGGQQHDSFWVNEQLENCESIFWRKKNIFLHVY